MAGTDSPSTPSDGRQASTTTPAPAKRRRITIACTSCRLRKSRCDGVRPQCSTCRALGNECLYTQNQASTTSLVAKSQVDSIESRLAAVERRLELLDGNTAQDARPSQAQEEHVESEDELNGGPASTDPTDGMGSITFTAEENAGYFGPSSNISFTRHIMRAIKSTINVSVSSSTPENRSAVDNYILHMSRPATPKTTKSPQALPLYALPPEDETRSLLRHFFATTGLLFPYIPENSFMETFEQVIASNTSKFRRSWLALLNMVLALATSTMTDSGYSAGERTSKSEAFYSRGVALCDKQIYHGTSVEVVQFLLVMGQYLQSTERSIETWSIHGLAVKAAYQLGLHSRDALSRLPPMEREIRTRTWYGCVILDRTLSMTYGRPCAIPESYIRLNLPSPCPTSSTESTSTQSVFFYNSTIKLYRVLFQVMEFLYGGNLGFGTPIDVLEIASRLFRVEQALADWQRNLPPTFALLQALSLSNDETSQSDVLRFRAVLTLRYHNLRILAYRTVVVKYMEALCSQAADLYQVSTSERVASDAILNCTHSATTIIYLVKHFAQSDGPRKALLGAWWFALYYTFNAALVVFFILLLRHRVRSGDQPGVFTNIDIHQSILLDAVEAMRSLDHGNRSIENCARYVSKLIHLLEVLAPESNNITAAAIPVAAPISGNSDATERELALPPEFANFNFGQSPVGIDMHGFVLSSDLDFLDNFVNQGYW